MEEMTSACAMSVKIINRLRSTLSTQAPMMSPKSRYGIYSAEATRARLKAEPVSLKTRSGSTKMVKELPTFETVCPRRNFQNSAPNLRLAGMFARLEVGGSCVMEIQPACPSLNRDTASREQGLN